MIEELISTHRVGDFSLESMISDQQAMNKRKREPLVNQTSNLSISPNIADEYEHYEFKSHKRNASSNISSIFTRLASEDSERRDSPIDDDDEANEFDEELNIVNAYPNSIFRRDEECRDDHTNSELSLTHEIISPTSKQDNYDMTFSPVSSFFHPAILRATTICESASDICPCGDPPEVDSRPSSPRVEAICDERDENAKSSQDKGKKDDGERPSWLTGTPRAFNWTLPAKSDAPSLFSSPWTGVFQLGSS